ncbi:SOS response-associated peptidase [Salinimicrobium oceani]|uniref:Abasic site processing protein n=1 Tax=Salinimicrobium oceani TaxID=2722702 RepID=A0ABX1CZX0_9FLAO|nr:SOS response-associated peptidase [Salinimicrobium oceani]NJW52464.1 SOS response-associated peptidase [Salinimicrobium oceani]
MCYRTKLNSRLSQIEKSFDASFIEPEAYLPMREINAFDFQKTPVILDENRGEIDFLQWGLVPFWAKDDKIKKMTLNAKIETLTEKPAFRNVVGNRCLILANGYYEWQWLDAKGKEKQKFLMAPEDQEVFAFAGIYSTWKDPASQEVVNSYTIITTEANELMSRIHNIKKRMPVVLKKEDRNNWLSGMEVSTFAFPYEVTLAATAV